MVLAALDLARSLRRRGDLDGDPAAFALPTFVKKAIAG